MSAKGYKGKVGVKEGFLFNKRTEKGYTTLSEALEAEARCGCGIDCCEGVVNIHDQEDGKSVSLYSVGGVLKFKDGDGAVYTVTLVAD